MATIDCRILNDGRISSPPIKCAIQRQTQEEKKLNKILTITRENHKVQEKSQKVWSSINPDDVDFEWQFVYCNALQGIIMITLNQQSINLVP